MSLMPIHLLILIVFANRYLVGVFMKFVKRSRFEVPENDYEPEISVVIPMFNEGKGIYQTLHSLLRQDYPPEKLKVIVVDDCSKDDSYEWAKRAETECPDRILVIRNPYNMGKRRGINNAVRNTDSEIIVSVDSDVVVEPTAIRRLIGGFTDPDMAAVGGSVHVSNPHVNWLTRMQTIKYYFGFEFLKSLERAFSSVMCLSGCLTAYRRHVLIELEPILEKRNILGVPIKYGEDRFLTRQIVKSGYKTSMILDAMCWTVAPDSISKYMSQQLRWRRSNIIDFICGLTHAWRLHPAVAIHYISLAALLAAYPVVVLQNLAIGAFFDLAVMHLVVLGFFGFVYWAGTRHLAPEHRVHPIWFLPLGVLMPMTYVLFTPLAIFTLDSSSWETRGHQGSEEPVSVATQETRPEGEAKPVAVNGPWALGGNRL